MVFAQTLKSWFLFNLRRAIGTQVLIERLVHAGGPPRGTPILGGSAPTTTSETPVALQPIQPTLPMTSAVVTRMQQLYERIVDASNSDAVLGFRRDHMPVLIDMNGDLIWIPSDLLRYLWHTHQPAEPAFIPHFLAETPHYVWIRDRLRPGDVALDCGANLGLFTTMMAERVGSVGAVHAFEPSPGARSDLERVVRLNQLNWVVVNPCAVADVCGEASFCDVTETDVRRESSHLQGSERSVFTASLAHHEVRVSVTTLDRYVSDKRIRPRLIKVDVEGAEFEVLEGGRSCIRDCRPLLVIEIHADPSGNFDHARLRRYLDEYAYSYHCQDKTYYGEPR
jgi:FkbM family methyltransferase